MKFDATPKTHIAKPVYDSVIGVIQTDRKKWLQPTTPIKSHSKNSIMAAEH